jgi:hypothetical protein
MSCVIRIPSSPSCSATIEVAILRWTLFVAFFERDVPLDDDDDA